jgi:hypothetical protein
VLDAQLDSSEENFSSKIPARPAGENQSLSLPQLPPETRQTILHALQQVHRLDQAWLVRKGGSLESLPLFILAIRLRRSWHQLGRNDAEHQAARRLSDRLRLPGKLLVIPWTGRQSALAKQAAAVHGAALHELQ